MLKHKNDFDSPKTPVRRKNSTVSIMSLPVSVNSSDSGTGTIRGAHGTIQGGAKSDKSAVSNLSLPVSVISVDSGTGTIQGAHGTPIKGAKSNNSLYSHRISEEFEETRQYFDTVVSFIGKILLSFMLFFLYYCLVILEFARFIDKFR